MSATAVDTFSYNDFPDRRMVGEYERDAAMQQLAYMMLHRHMLSEADPASALFDPIEGLSILKYHLIGSQRLLTRYNSAFPPGVGRETRRGNRVYGVECAALVDPGTGWMEILRKDDIVDSADPTDWLSIRYNILTGDYEEPHVIGVRTDTTDAGDNIQLTVDPPTDYRHANRGPSIVSVTLDRMYHATSPLQRGRRKYYGRGIGGEPLQSEGTFGYDISYLFESLQELIEAADLPRDLLDRGAKLREHEERTRQWGGHILSIRHDNIYAASARADVC